ncbi:MAG: hypothetical protein M1357_01090 [Candidatus Marsarchaeota archaeon]|nr:hypothetical protein [Candidatus Marsarchaeota archaeon]
MKYVKRRYILLKKNSDEQGYPHLCGLLEQRGAKSYMSRMRLIAETPDFMVVRVGHTDLTFLKDRIASDSSASFQTILVSGTIASMKRKLLVRRELSRVYEELLPRLKRRRTK